MTRAIVLHQHGGPEILGAESNGFPRPVECHRPRDRASLMAMAGELLAQAGGADAALQARRTTGAAVLIP